MKFSMQHIENYKHIYESIFSISKNCRILSWLLLQNTRCTDNNNNVKGIQNYFSKNKLTHFHEYGEPQTVASICLN